MGSPEKSKKIQKQKKHKKQKKDKKQKKQKKHKRQKQYKSPSPPSHYAPKIQQPHRQVAVTSNHPQQSNFQQEMPQQRMIIPCRRCKQRTFSLKTRTCSACGYPKQQRPQYFPKTKQVQVLDLVRQGKLVHNSYAPVLIQVIANDRFGKKQRVKCCPTDTIFDFKKLISAQTGTRPEKIRLQKANIIYKDHLTLEDYEIKDGTGLQMYYD